MNLQITAKSFRSTVSGNDLSVRDYTLDTVAGILILRMIIGHYMTMCNLQDTFLFDTINILYFYMPWFFYKSGMFCSKERKEPKAYLIKNFKKFVVPFIFFALFGTLIAALSAVITGKSVLSTILSDWYFMVFHESTSWNSPLWFLLTLFFVKVIFNFVRDSVNHNILMAISLFLAYLHYLFLANNGIWWLGNFCSGLFFFIWGMKLKDIQYTILPICLSIFVIIAVGVFTPPSSLCMGIFY